MQEQHKGYDTAVAEFNKTIVRNNIEETSSQINKNMTEIKMSGISKHPTMKRNENGDDF